MKKILFVNEAHPVLEQRLTAAGFHCDFDFKGSKEVIESKLEYYDGIVIRSRFKVDKVFLEKGKHLDFIARIGVGTEHIDLEYAAELGIKILTSPEGSRDAVGEHSMGLLLMLMNHLSRADRQVRNGIWLREENRGHEIKDRVVGILGYGNMGKAFAQRLSGFECAEVIAYDKYKEDYGDQYARAVSIEELWEKSDILSIHIPYMPSNHHFIDGAFISAFSKPIYIVNTARGTVLKTDDLVAHMERGKVLGAALDVIEYEEMSFEFMDFSQIPPAFEYLLKSDKTVLNPHIGGWSFESKEGHAMALANKILSL